MDDDDDAEVLKERRSPRERGRMGTSHGSTYAASDRRRTIDGAIDRAIDRIYRSMDGSSREEGRADDATHHGA